MEFGHAPSKYSQAPFRAEKFERISNRRKVALLNIGTEGVKGTDSVRGAFELLKSTPSINFKGYIEASEFLEGNVDVIVADGFVGNVMLKIAEATASTFINLIKQEVLNSWATKMLVGILLKSKLNKALTRFKSGESACLELAL